MEEHDNADIHAVLLAPVGEGVAEVDHVVGDGAGDEHVEAVEDGLERHGRHVVGQRRVQLGCRLLGVELTVIDEQAEVGKRQQNVDDADEVEDTGAAKEVMEREG